MHALEINLKEFIPEYLKIELYKPKDMKNGTYIEVANNIIKS